MFRKGTKSIEVFHENRVNTSIKESAYEEENFQCLSNSLSLKVRVIDAFVYGV